MQSLYDAGFILLGKGKQFTEYRFVLPWLPNRYEELAARRSGTLSAGHKFGATTSL